MLNLILASAHLLPEFLTEYALNIIIIMMGDTITVMVVSEGARKICKKYKWQIRGMRSIMTISEWIKSRIKSDTDHKLASVQHRPKQIKKHNHRHGCKRYVNPKRRGHTFRIGNNHPSFLQRPKVVCTDFPSLSPNTRSNIRSKPQKFAVYYNSFTICIDNHASTNISNRSSHFLGTITPVRGKWSKILEEWSK